MDRVHARSRRSDRHVDAGQGRRDSKRLHELVDIGVIQARPAGRQTLWVHPKLLRLLMMESNAFGSYGRMGAGRLDAQGVSNVRTETSADDVTYLAVNPTPGGAWLPAPSPARTACRFA